jgi:hypothetical protein
LGDWTAERDALFALTREAEEAARRSAEAQSSVALRVRMLESNMRLVEAYGNASSPTQRMVEGAVIERHRRRANILHSHVDDNGRPLDVDTDDEADEDVRRSLLEEGYVRIDAPVGQSQQRAWYARRDSTTPEVLRFVSPEPFVPLSEAATTEIVDAETSSDEEAAVEEREEQPMSTARREALVIEVQRQIDALRSQQSPPQERAPRYPSWRQEVQEFMAEFEERIPPAHDQPPAAAVVPQEGEQEPVWYYRRAREMALDDAERMQEPVLETTPPVPNRVEGWYRPSSDSWSNTVRTAREAARTNNRASSVWVRQKVRTDLKALLHAVQEKLDEEIEASRNGQSFREGSYVALVNLVRDTFRCVERI